MKNAQLMVPLNRYLPIEVHSPLTGEVLAEVPDATPDDVQSAVERARRAQGDWASRPFAERALALRRLARRIRDDSTLIETLVSESGKPTFEAEIFELLYTLELTRFYTGRSGHKALADEFHTPALFPHKRSRIVYHPRGVVGVVGPWNWPLLNNFADCVAPLVAGNAVVLKPSEWTPLTSLRVAQLWRDQGLPADVFQVVTGRGEAGQALVEQVDMVFFTGSRRVGRLVAKAGAERMIPVVLELGGKSAMIVLRDADLPRAARAAIWSGFAHSGQVCVRTERVFVEEPVADRFIDLCIKELGRLRHGPSPASPNFDIGAMTFPPQMTIVENQIADAVAQGARLVGGGRRVPRPGNYFEPTLVINAQPGMKIMEEETFGPALPIMRVASAQEALRLTNLSPLGLSGSVWSKNLTFANALARRIESGSVCVNDVLFNYLCVEAPLGGVKGSGIGVRHGIEGLRQFCRIETVLEDRAMLKFISGFVGDLIGFPYNDVLRKWIRRFMRLWY